MLVAERMKSIKQLLTILTLLFGILNPFNSVQAQQTKTSLQNTAFSEAVVQWNKDMPFPEDIKMGVSSRMGRKEFFSALRGTFDLPEQIQFVPDREQLGPLGNTSLQPQVFRFDPAGLG